MSRVLFVSLMVTACAWGPALLAQDAPASAASVDQHAARPAGPIKPGDRNCLRSTGSHITPPKGGCLPVTGRSYTREEILRTGAPDTAAALRQLDPSIGH